ncbi:class F sortase [Nocardioides guangzhouensis]|uniref:Class F sortase n=1 Tax=Nocardioides guangzhouensis TaxID=2497878 RepID=A0A4Q4ZBZ6_9ACTN|nr:class F sortase [Nocardioides guangzhouensis]RYP85095.1 class F sortase [Nocardioides guangzhouensis]
MATPVAGPARWLLLLLASAAGLALGAQALHAGRDDPTDVRGRAAVADAGTQQPGANGLLGHGTGPTADPAPDRVGRSSAAIEGQAAGAATPDGGLPARLEIPALGVDMVVRPAGVTATGAMELPADPAVIGWYRYGPAPETPGSAVLAGHVDSRRYGVGPLARLSAITAGERIRVVLGSGSRRPYRVDSIERFDRQALPDEVFARTGPERLRIVTCTGPYLEDAGGYLQNLVITALPDLVRSGR